MSDEQLDMELSFGIGDRKENSIELGEDGGLPSDAVKILGDDYLATCRAELDERLEFLAVAEGIGVDEVKRGLGACSTEIEYRGMELDLVLYAYGEKIVYAHTKPLSEIKGGKYCLWWFSKSI